MIILYILIILAGLMFMYTFGRIAYTEYMQDKV